MRRTDGGRLYPALERRVLAGESKADIYAGYLDDAEARRCAKLLAQIPTPARRHRCRWLNRGLLALLGVLALITKTDRTGRPRFEA